MGEGVAACDRMATAFPEFIRLLLMTVYQVTSAFPPEERYGLTAQVRRSALSIPLNIVEGSARPTSAEYGRFLVIAMASARECEYLLRLAVRLHMVNAGALDLAARYSSLQAGLLKAVRGIQDAG